MSSQKFIGRNRAPRVQIEYDVEVYGADKKIQLPFVMAVLADLRGNAGEAQAALPERKFLEISADNLDERLAGMAPRVTLRVPDLVNGAGELAVEIGFECLDDFSPSAIARKVPALEQLLETRCRLQNLITYMDGKSGAEELIARLLNEPATRAALTEGTSGEAAAASAEVQP